MNKVYINSIHFNKLGAVRNGTENEVKNGEASNSALQCTQHIKATREKKYQPLTTPTKDNKTTIRNVMHSQSAKS